MNSNKLYQSARAILVEHEVRELFEEAEVVPGSYQRPTDLFERPTLNDGHLMVGQGYDVARAVDGELVAVYHLRDKIEE
jgi:hypothetical protein